MSLRSPRPTRTEPVVREETYSARSAIHGAAAEHNRLYVVRRGRIRLLRSLAGTRPHLADLLGPGGIFGKLPSSATCRPNDVAIAETEAVVWSADSSQLDLVCASHPQFGQELLAGLGRSLHRDRVRLRSLASSEIPARLSAALLQLGDELGEPCPHGGVTDLRRISQEDVADLIGASRSFVSTLINEMKRWGWLGNSGRILCLRDIGALQKAAFDDE